MTRTAPERRRWWPALAGFVLLDLYQRVLPDALDATGALWLAIFLLYFPLAALVGRWSGAGGLAALGLALHPGWRRRLLLGAAIGIGAWLLLVAAQFATGQLRFLGWTPPAQAAWIGAQAFAVAVLGSASNDVLVRGYVFAHLRGRLPLAWIVAVSALLSTLDDVWLGGASLHNLAFSLLLGIAFALTLARHGSLWMNIGLHAGLNLVYWCTFGFESGATRTGLARLEIAAGTGGAWLGVAAAAAMLAIVIAVTGRRRTRAPRGALA